MRPLAAAAVAALLLAACGGGGPSATVTPASTSAPPSVAPSTSVPTTEDLTPVRLLLRSPIGADAAGYVAAIEQGYYESAGLDVTLVEGGADVAPEIVGSARDGPEFTVSWVPRILAARAAGMSDLVDIAQLFQRSSTLMMSFRDEEITSVSDVRDKRVGVLIGADRLEVTAALTQAGLRPDRDVTLVDLGGSIEPFLSGSIDVAQVTIHDTYATVLETEVQQGGRSYQPTDFDVITLADEGTAMLQDALFARASWLAEQGNEATATAFLRASVQGWTYCRDHPADCVESVVATGVTIDVDPSASPSVATSPGSDSPPPRLRAGHVAWAMNEVNALIWPSPAGIGVMDPKEWQHTVDVLIAAGAIGAAPSAEAYRTDLIEAALESLSDLDTTGGSFVKGTVEITPGGG